MNKRLITQDFTKPISHGQNAPRTLHLNPFKSSTARVEVKPKTKSNSNIHSQQPSESSSSSSMRTGRTVENLNPISLSVKPQVKPFPSTSAPQLHPRRMIVNTTEAGQVKKIPATRENSSASLKLNAPKVLKKEIGSETSTEPEAVSIPTTDISERESFLCKQLEKYTNEIVPNLEAKLKASETSRVEDVKKLVEIVQLERANHNKLHSSESSIKRTKHDDEDVEQMKDTILRLETSLKLECDKVHHALQENLLLQEENQKLKMDLQHARLDCLQQRKYMVSRHMTV